MSPKVITLFHLEKLEDLACAQEYAVAASKQFNMLSTLEDLEELWDKIKLLKLQSITWERCLYLRRDSEKH